MEVKVRNVKEGEVQKKNKNTYFALAVGLDFLTHCRLDPYSNSIGVGRVGQSMQGIAGTGGLQSLLIQGERDGRNNGPAGNLPGFCSALQTTSCFSFNFYHL